MESLEELTALFDTEDTSIRGREAHEAWAVWDVDGSDDARAAGVAEEDTDGDAVWAAAVQRAHTVRWARPMPPSRHSEQKKPSPGRHEEYSNHCQADTKSTQTITRHMHTILGSENKLKMTLLHVC
jgi:hypothetical protein